MTDTTAALAAALAKVQSELPKLERDRTVEHGIQRLEHDNLMTRPGKRVACREAGEPSPHNSDSWHGLKTR